jgi:hypothetical protein
MEDILNKIILNKTKDKSPDKKDNISFDILDLELNLKIEREKTKQLELIKDIRKIEKSIKEKELYCKRKQTVVISDSDSNTDSDSDSDLDSDLESDLDSDTENNCKKYNNIVTTEKTTIDLKDSIKSDTISLCSVDSDYNYTDEIEINIK